MTKFDPKFALEVMQRRQKDFLKEAADLNFEKFILQIEDRIPMWGGAASEMDKEIHELWRQADSYDSVIRYLEGRIRDEMSPAERTWQVLRDWSYAASGPELVADVLTAHRIASGEEF